MKNIYHKRLEDFEAFDRIEMKVVPRFKTSGLSGDEWRTSVLISFYFKGVEVASTSVRDMQTAIMLLGYEWTIKQEPIPEEVIKIEKDVCDQPGCNNLATTKFMIDKLFSSHGERLDPNDTTLKYYRQFCERHSRRGDCSREDCDDNYLPL